MRMVRSRWMTALLVLQTVVLTFFLLRYPPANWAFMKSRSDSQPAQQLRNAPNAPLMDHENAKPLSQSEPGSFGFFAVGLATWLGIRYFQGQHLAVQATPAPHVTPEVELAPTYLPAVVRRSESNAFKQAA